MARSASQAARLAFPLSQSAGFLIRRAYSGAAAAPSGVVKRVEEKAAASTSSKSKKTGGAAEPSAPVAWVPDPVTGYYRPANRPAELDAAEMRQRLLSRRFHH